LFFFFSETPLTLAVTVKKPARVLIALVNGGALLDYRTRDGSTALHRAVEAASLEALSTLLELGASPNYRDAKGLTPLYLTVTTRADPMLTRTLLHERATIGAQDTQGWQEVHQVRNTISKVGSKTLTFALGSGVITDCVKAFS